jgi:lipoate-protein ligase A
VENVDTEWKIIDTGCQNAEENMRFDTELLESADALFHPILHFYEWSGDSVTYGYFTDPSKFLNLDKARRFSLQLARRPTGGGIVFHSWDMAFSILVPAACREFSLNTLENYAFVNNAVLAAVKEFLDHQMPLSLTPEDLTSWDPNCSHFCMAKPTKYDVMWERRKIAGAAQRKTRKGFLHQGTIALAFPNIEYLDQILLPETKVRDAMLAHTCPLLGKCLQTSEMNAAKQRLRILLATHLRRASLTLRA